MTTALQLVVKPPCWEMSAPDLTHFIAELGEFGDSGYVLNLDGVIAADVENYLRARPGPIENRTDQGFLKMRSKEFFMPITGENAQGLARLSENHADPEVCDHLRVYEGNRLILSWHDVPFDPVYFGSEVAEARVRKLSASL
ncbi:MAG TPA: hypothetical protein VIR01_18195, partial [Pyrinomonadaceae bacterium]